jgi:predicted alpha/beta hydrolase
VSAPSASTPSASTLRLAARDGFALGATLYEAAAATGEPRPLALIAPATGVLRRLYQPFASFLAGAGFDVLTWDWRGTGDSRPPSLRGFAATMTDWAALDFAGALDWAAAHAGERPLLAVGHSFGGQALGLVADDAPASLAAAVTVAAQSGYWGRWPSPQRYYYAGIWYLLVPALTALYGYFPSRLLGFGEDLPAGVARQWARWCRSPGYLGDWRGHERFAAPILALGFADDPYAPRAAVDELHRHYAAAAVERRQLAPHELGVRRIGHFGFFKPGVPALWREVAGWMTATLAARRRPAQPVPPAPSALAQ